MPGRENCGGDSRAFEPEVGMDSMEEGWRSKRQIA